MLYCIFALLTAWWWAQAALLAVAIGVTWHILSFATLKKGGAGAGRPRRGITPAAGRQRPEAGLRGERPFACHEKTTRKGRFCFQDVSPHFNPLQAACPCRASSSRRCNSPRGCPEPGLPKSRCGAGRRIPVRIRTLRCGTATAAIRSVRTRGTVRPGIAVPR